MGKPDHERTVVLCDDFYLVSHAEKAEAFFFGFSQDEIDRLCRDAARETNKILSVITK